MKRLIYIAVVCTFVAGPVMAEPQVQIQGYAGYRSASPWPGGEFTVVLGNGWGSPNPTQYYVDSPGAGTRNVQGTTNTFQTFCVERDETFQWSIPYEVTISDAAIFDGSPPTGSDPISKATAYLYRQFATGKLTGYDYDLTGDRADKAEDLQKAIWTLEDDLNNGEIAGWIRDALAAEFSEETHWKEDANGAYGVKVMNLWDVGFAGVEGHQRQDMLVLVPTPAAVLLALLGLGSAGMKLRKHS